MVPGAATLPGLAPITRTTAAAGGVVPALR